MNQRRPPEPPTKHYCYCEKHPYANHTILIRHVDHILSILNSIYNHREFIVTVNFFSYQILGQSPGVAEGPATFGQR